MTIFDVGIYETLDSHSLENIHLHEQAASLFYCIELPFERSGITQLQLTTVDEQANGLFYAVQNIVSQVFLKGVYVKLVTYAKTVPSLLSSGTSFQQLAI